MVCARANYCSSNIFPVEYVRADIREKSIKTNFLSMTSRKMYIFTLFLPLSTLMLGMIGAMRIFLFLFSYFTQQVHYTRNRVSILFIFLKLFWFIFPSFRACYHVVLLSQKVLKLTTWLNENVHVHMTQRFIALWWLSCSIRVQFALQFARNGSILLVDKIYVNSLVFAQLISLN